MFSKRVALALATAGIAAVTLGGCGSPALLTPNVPNDVAAVEQSSPTASALTARGYSPVYVLRGNDSYAWATCPATTAAGLARCSKELNFQGSGDTPNVFTLDGRVAYLEAGSQDYVIGSGIVVWVTIPRSSQWDFSSLTVTQQKQILALTSVAKRELGRSNTMTLELSINGKEYQFSVRVGDDWPSDVVPGHLCRSGGAAFRYGRRVHRVPLSCVFCCPFVSFLLPLTMSVTGETSQVSYGALGL